MRCTSWVGEGGLGEETGDRETDLVRSVARLVSGGPGRLGQSHSQWRQLHGSTSVGTNRPERIQGLYTTTSDSLQLRGRKSCGHNIAHDLHQRGTKYGDCADRPEQSVGEGEVCTQVHVPSAATQHKLRRLRLLLLLVVRCWWQHEEGPGS
jgi:hypothetical protein